MDVGTFVNAERNGQYPLKRVNHLYEILISDENIIKAIDAVNKTHRWRKGHKPNKITEWVEKTKEERVKDLRNIIIEGYVPNTHRILKRYDVGAKKWRTITEPSQYPDQYIHHILIQTIQPVMMRGMDMYCCGSIKGRGIHYAKNAIESWVRTDRKKTKYCLTMDIKHFYDNLTQEVVLGRMRCLIKDRKVLDLIERVTSNGIKIGAYPSQWFANTTLQPLDNLIRQSGYCSYYVRYMDNFTILGSNKRKLHKLKDLTEHWLNEHGLELKDNWQVYLVADDTKSNGRLVDAVGYRYGRGFTIPRKHTLLRTKRIFARYRKRMANDKTIYPSMAKSILSRLGMFAHCNNNNIFTALFDGDKIQYHLKSIIRQTQLQGGQT